VNLKLNKKILIENIIYNILDYNEYIIYSWLNWKFEFSFYWKKDKEKLFIHVSEEKNKEDIKKEVNKLNKIKCDWRRYLLVENIKEIWIKKIKYDNVLIIEINEFLINFKQK